MADISKITLPSGQVYNIKDTQARASIETIESSITGGLHYLGVTTTALVDDSNTNPITIGGKSVTAKTGDIVIYGKLEFVFSDTDNKWHEFGSTGSLKALAFKDNAQATYTPGGSVTTPTFTGDEETLSTQVTPSGSVAISVGSGTANYTPAGTVSQPTTTVTLDTTTVNSITDVGTLPSLTMTVSNETLTFGWNAGDLPTKGDNTTVATGVQSAVTTQPVFTGTGQELIASFTGEASNVNITYTPTGTVSTPQFNGTADTIVVS